MRSGASHVCAQEANRKHDLSLVEYLVKEVFFYVGLEHLKMSIQLRRHPTIQARCTLLQDATWRIKPARHRIFLLSDARLNGGFQVEHPTERIRSRAARVEMGRASPVQNPMN